VPLRPEAVPPAVRYLLPAAEEWGIGDDFDREQMVGDADDAARTALVALIDGAPDELWSWLSGTESFNESPSGEYVALTCLTMAADSARLTLRRP
jgi:hypothetical protein